MSQENVETFKRAIDAYNRRDIDAFLEALDPEVELQGALQALLEGETTLYRGHEGVRQWVRDIDEALADIRLELPEIRDLGDRLVALGRLSARGTASGADTESRFGCVVEWKNGKATEAALRAHLDLTHHIIAPKGQRIASVSPMSTQPIPGSGPDELVLPVKAGDTFTVHFS